MECCRCGKKISSTTTGDDTCNNCKNKSENKGWICPSCGRSLSPNVINCPFCKPVTETGNMTHQGKTILME